MSLVINTGAVVLFYSALADAWVPYGCARSGDINISTEFIESTIKGNGVWSNFRPTKNNFTGSIEGLHNLETPGLLSIADLLAFQFAQTKLLMRFDYTSEAGNSHVLECNFYISAARINHSFDNVSTFNVDFRGTGIITQSFTPTPIIRGIVIRREFTIISGQDDITIPEIDGLDPDNLLFVTLNGYSYDDVILTGVPVGLPGGSQVLFEPSGGKLVFPSAVPLDTLGTILYQTIISGS